MQHALLVLALAVLCVIGKSFTEEFKNAVTSSLEISGVSQNEYAKGDTLVIWVDRLTAKRTQMTYDYYFLPFCEPAERFYNDGLVNLFTGAKPSTSLYALSFFENSDCEVLGSTWDVASPPWGSWNKEPGVFHNEISLNSCTHVYNAEEVNLFREFIRNGYKAQASLDGMPAAQQKSQNEMLFSIGYSIGFMEDEEYHLNNHLSIIVRYRNAERKPDEPQTYYIVGFEVAPASIDYTQLEANINTCTGPLLKLDVDKPKNVTWTYSVRYVYEETEWSDRLKRYYSDGDSEIHWFSLVNSILIVLLLTGMVGTILARTICADVAHIRTQIEAQTDPDIVDSKGWKHIYGDVFRGPKFGSLLASLIAFGVQTFGTFVICLVITSLSPYSVPKASVLITGLVFFGLFGIISGYVSARLGSPTTRQALYTAFCGPSVVFLLAVIGNSFVDERAFSKLSFLWMFIILALWLCLSLPLVYVGNFLARFSKQSVPPVSVNKVPRMIPKGSFYINAYVHCLVGGLIAFGAIFVELYFLFGSVWGTKIHALMGFILAVISVLLLTVTLVSVLLCYFQLCAENYRWQWRSFFTGASISFYFVLYSFYYGWVRLKLNSFSAFMVYLSYSSALAALCGAACGAVSYFAVRKFVWKLYAAVPFE